eukprot:scaffold213132_cov24-Tisochrysis_lutea.AAC.1
MASMACPVHPLLWNSACLTTRKFHGEICAWLAGQCSVLRHHKGWVATEKLTSIALALLSSNAQILIANLRF